MTKKHDPQKCLGCRIGMLVHEFYPHGPSTEQEKKYLLMSYANAAAITLAEMDDHTTLEYLMMIMMIRDRVINDVMEESEHHLHH